MEIIVIARIVQIIGYLMFLSLWPGIPIGAWLEKKTKISHVIWLAIVLLIILVSSIMVMTLKNH